MSFLKKIFGEDISIVELYEYQKKLTELGMNLKCQDLIKNLNGKCYYSTLNDLVVENIKKHDNSFKNIGYVHDFVVAFGIESEIIRFKPKYDYSINKSGRILIQFLYYRNEDLPFIKSKINNLKNEIELLNIDSDTLNKLNGTSHYSHYGRPNTIAGAFSTVSIFLADNPEIEKKYSSTKLIESYLKDGELKRLQSKTNNLVYQSETYFRGELINSHELKKHKVVIDALCILLNGLRQREKYPTYEKLESAAKQFIIESGFENKAYWNEIHRIYYVDKFESFPFGYFVTGSAYLSSSLKGIINTNDIIYLRPFIKGIQYGCTLVVTDNGYEIA